MLARHTEVFWCPYFQNSAQGAEIISLLADLFWLERRTSSKKREYL